MMDEMPVYEIAEPLQNSIEIGQSSKGDWYCKGIKLYFGNNEQDRLNVIGQLFSLKDRVVAQLGG